MLKQGVERNSNGIFCWPVFPISKLILIQCGWYGIFDVIHYQSFQTFCQYGCTRHRPVIFQVYYPRCFRYWKYCGCFKACWDPGWGQRDVIYCGEVFFANSPTQSLSTLPSTLSGLAAFLGLMLRRSHLMCGLTSPHVWSGLGQCHRRASTVVSVNCCLSRSEYRTNLSPQIRWHKYPLREMCSSYSPLLPWCPPTPPEDFWSY